MKHKILYSISFLLIAISSCISEFNADLPPQESDLLVVEGNIIGDTLSVFSLSKTYSMDNPAGMTNDVWAMVTIIDSNGGETPPAQHTGGGRYQINTGKLDDNLSYGLRVEYNGDVYLSELSKPVFTPEIDSVSVKQFETAGDVHFYITTHDREDGARYYMWNYAEDWEIVSFYHADIMFNIYTGQFELIDRNNPFYYCWKSNRIQKILLATSDGLKENRIIDRELISLHPQEGERFSELYSMLVSQQALSKPAYEYYLNKRKINEEMGGLFTPQPSEFYGNITCLTNPDKRAIGYVEVTKNVSRKRIFVQGYSISKPPVHSNCELISADSVKVLINTLLGEGSGYMMIYQMGLRPVTRGMGMLPEDWSTVSCVECTYRGTKNRPDYWPNDHQ